MMPEGAGVEGRLLLVEDDPAVRSILQLLLEAAGWKVQPAIDGTMGLALVTRSPPDVVVTDLRMPDISGIELAGTLASSGDSTIPVVAITSDTSRLREIAIRSGLFTDVLTKPLVPSTLLASVQRAAEGAR